MTTSSLPRQTAHQPKSDGQPIHVVLVEDDHDLRQGLAEYLRLSGISVTDLSSAISFYKALRTDVFDIAILDVNLPDASGFELARDLSAERRPGIIMLTARTGRDDRIRGYAEGADLYLTKPVDGEELLLAVRNLARRVHTAAVTKAERINARQPAVWQIETQRRLLVAPGGVSLQLSGRELLLLEYLAQAEGATVARAGLAKHLGYGEMDVESRSLDAVLRRLRQKAQDCSIELPLLVIHAVGIRFSAPLVRT